LGKSKLGSSKLRGNTEKSTEKRRCLGRGHPHVKKTADTYMFQIPGEIVRDFCKEQKNPRVNHREKLGTKSDLLGNFKSNKNSECK